MNEPVTIGIPNQTHEAMKREAEARGMRLRAFPVLLMELWQLRTPEQEREAYERMKFKASKRKTLSA